MDLRLLDLDGSLTAQPSLVRQRPEHCSLHDWAPSIRLACRFSHFERFQAALVQRLGSAQDHEPCLTYFGSGDFHHVSLALLRRLATPFNLLVVDNHPDWMRGVPFLHCGTWVYHAAQLPLARQIFHVGGEVDFDNHYRWLAPWAFLRSGRLTVIPAQRRFCRGRWAAVAHGPLRPAPEVCLSAERMDWLLWPYRHELARWPLYISVDKDVLGPSEAVVNWDSGRLELAEAGRVIEAFGRAANGRLAGVDIVGDWSPVQVRGALRRFLHLTEHPWNAPEPAQANECNDRANDFLRTMVASVCAGQHAERSLAARDSIG